MIPLKVRESLEKINRSGQLRFDEPLASHCTFKVGGPADALYHPTKIDELVEVLAWAKHQTLPVTIIGGGSNIVPSDQGLRGLVVATTGLDGVRIEGSQLTADSGCSMTEVSAAAAEAGLAGLDFIYAMPGSVGGAVWMNARCYGGEIAGILDSVVYLDANLVVQTYRTRAEDFAYKLSPFQSQPWIILSATFRLVPGDKTKLWEAMRDHQADRTAKGHFRAPCAGSVFKNNQAFGEPSGKIIDGLGLRGTRIGGACVSPDHANIIINDAGASASDIKDLTDLVQSKVHAARGWLLEPEVIFLGQF